MCKEWWYACVFCTHAQDVCMFVSNWNNRKPLPLCVLRIRSSPFVIGIGLRWSIEVRGAVQPWSVVAQWTVGVEFFLPLASLTHVPIVPGPAKTFSRDRFTMFVCNCVTFVCVFVFNRATLRHAATRRWLGGYEAIARPRGGLIKAKRVVTMSCALQLSSHVSVYFTFSYRLSIAWINCI